MDSERINVYTSVLSADPKKINTDFEYKYQSTNIPNECKISCNSNYDVNK